MSVLLNLDPKNCHTPRNVLPLLFRTDNDQPKDIQSFFVPLLNALLRVIDQDGIPMLFHDGIYCCVRIHPVWVSTELQVLMKVSSTTGQNGKHPCRFCEISGVYIGHYYFPSCLYKHGPSRRERRDYYDPRQLPLRTTLAIEDTF